jgi:hypothetical protein
MGLFFLCANLIGGAGSNASPATLLGVNVRTLRAPTKGRRSAEASNRGMGEWEVQIPCALFAGKGNRRRYSVTPTRATAQVPTRTYLVQRLHVAHSDIAEELAFFVLDRDELGSFGHGRTMTRNAGSITQKRFEGEATEVTKSITGVDRSTSFFFLGLCAKRTLYKTCPNFCCASLVNHNDRFCVDGDRRSPSLRLPCPAGPAWLWTLQLAKGVRHRASRSRADNKSVGKCNEPEPMAAPLAMVAVPSTQGARVVCHLCGQVQAFVLFTALQHEITELLLPQPNHIADTCPLAYAQRAPTAGYSTRTDLP